MARQGQFNYMPDDGRINYQTNGYVDDDTTTTAGLKSLQSTEEKRLFDIVDKLRSLDLNHELELPQLVVCGSQSSGKSSVLEAISQLDFPRGDMTCTRFVTEIQFRRRDTPYVQVDIIPDKDRKPEIQKQLREARFATSDPKQLAAIIKEAEKRMGITGDTFSKDILRVQIGGPDCQPLTLVDLPGLIESHTQGKQHIQTVSDIVDQWIQEKRSIILAVVDASTDPQRQGILSRAKEVDPTGERTFGIITKPDLPERGSGLERFWIDRARNSSSTKADFNFKKGWHVLRNSGFKERQAGALDRDATERQFFLNRSENWHVVDPKYWGITTLRSRLRALLYEHTKKQLPQIRSDIAASLDRHVRDLRVLESRLLKPETLWLDYLRERSQLAGAARAGISGIYNDALYSETEGDMPQNLRTHIEYANDAFDNEMRTEAHGIAMPGSQAYFEEVQRVLRTSRGQEHPGHNNIQRLDILFWRHSRLWKSVAERHIERCDGFRRAFIVYMIKVFLQGNLPSLPDAICSKLVENFERAMETHRELAGKELDKLEQDRKRATQTRNMAFVKTQNRNRAERSYTATMRLLSAEENETVAGDKRAPRISPAYLQKVSGQDASSISAEDIGTDMLNHYEIARDCYVDNILIQVIERHLLDPLADLFGGLFGIEQQQFFEIINDEDTQGLEEEKKELEQRIERLRSFQAELI